MNTSQQAHIEPQAYSITEFCKRHSISRGLFYVLDQEGKAPATMSVGRRRLISKESADQWRREMTAASSRRCVDAREAA